MSKDTIVFYHADNCMDGLASAAVAYEYLKESSEYIGFSYGSRLPLAKCVNKTVYLLDISFNPDTIEDLKSLLEIAHKVIWLDHHASSLTTWCGEGVTSYGHHSFSAAIILDKTKSGCHLTYSYFKIKQAVPELLLYIEDRDLWKFRLPNSKEINRAIYSIATSIKTMHHLIFTNLKMTDESSIILIELGKQLLKSDDMTLNNILAANASKATLTYFCKEKEEYKTIGLVICNAPAIFRSELGFRINLLHDKIALVWTCLSSGKVKISLRSVTENVDKIAESFGGGGHDYAAGFHLSLEHFMEVISYVESYSDDIDVKKA